MAPTSGRAGERSRIRSGSGASRSRERGAGGTLQATPPPGTRGKRAERDARWRRFIIAAQDGDAAAYEALLTDLLPPLRAFVHSRLRGSPASEDVVQNVLMSLHRARHTYRPERPFGPWLWAIARNAVLDHLRERSRRAAREVHTESEHPAPPPSVERPLSTALVHALDALPPSQREAVELVQLQGLSVAEAAERAGVSTTALKVRAHRGYRALRDLLPRPSE